MTKARADFLLGVIGRPLLLVFWVLILWGTFYAFVLLHAMAEDGIAPAFRRALSGQDALAGLGNLALSACAVIVWALVGVVVWRSRHRTPR